MRGSVALRSGKKSGEETLAMVSERLFLSRRSQKVVAKVNRPCYYGFARYIKRLTREVSSGVWYFVNFIDYDTHFTLNFLNCQALLLTFFTFDMVHNVEEVYLCFMTNM